MPLPSMINQPGSAAVPRYFDPNLQAWAIKVPPGCWEIAEHQEHLLAITASAVAMLLWDSANGRAGVAHFMVEPHAPATWTSETLGSPHADAMLDSLWQAMQPPASESEHPEFHAYVVGGGSILLNGKMVVGQANVIKAVDWLYKKSIPLDHYDVGQAVLRKTTFNPLNGEITVRRIVATRNDTVRQREEDYLDSLQPKTTKEYDQ